jgi:hypothetical protein
VAVQKLSQIALSPAAPIAADTFIGVNGGNTDYQFSLTQLISGIGTAGGSGITVNTTPISGGTSGQLFYDNAGTVGETPGTIWQAGGILSVSNSNNVMTEAIRVYNTVDTVASPTNYESGVMDWTTTYSGGTVTNQLTVGTQAGGAGVLRELTLSSAGQNINFWSVSSGFIRRVFMPIDANTFAMMADPNFGPASTFRTRLDAFTIYSWGGIVIGSNAPDGSVGDTSISRGGTAGTITAGTFAFTQKNATGTKPCGLQVYNVTDGNTSTVPAINGASIVPTNYERGLLDWTTTAGVLTIGAQSGGTGAAHDVALVAATAAGTTTEVLRLMGATSPTATLKFSNAASFTANGANASTTGNIYITAHTAIKNWLTLVDNAGTTFYVPCY